VKTPVWMINDTPEDFFTYLDSIVEAEKDSIITKDEGSQDPTSPSESLWFNEPKMNSWIWSKLLHANRNSFAVDISHIFEMQWTKLSEGEFEDWHQDIRRTTNYVFDRKLTAILQLSDGDEYEGGDLVFDGIELDSRSREKGTVIIFPSYTQHRITRVTKGVRKSLVSWAEGPQWR